MTSKKILYITYDGLTDPLGQSQVLPYVKGLSSLGYQFTILSFEKRDRYNKGKHYIEKLTSESNIRWVPLFFTKNPPILSKIYDNFRMRRMAFRLQRKYKYDMAHCRSYVPADTGLALKKKFGIKFFFDMRGFWADERKDSGAWDLSNPFFKRVYKKYKRKEAAYLQNADYVIVLTHAARTEIMKWNCYNMQIPAEVITTCADFDLFSLTDPRQKKESKEKLGVPVNSFVLSYLGSLGTWYMMDEMLLFFKELKKNYPSAVFLIITPTPREVIENGISRAGLLINDFIIKEVSRQEVPFFIKASDINISFIKPVYSKISSSPTKLGEVLAMGIPVICNSGVGDVKQIIDGTRSGFVIDNFTENDFEKAIQYIPSLLEKRPSEIRNSAKDIFSLDKGIQSYYSCYRQILS
jgi:glycosyltransferase involved in cell wall biosynthesis